MESYPIRVTLAVGIACVACALWAGSAHAQDPTATPTPTATATPVPTAAAATPLPLDSYFPYFQPITLTHQFTMPTINIQTIFTGVSGAGPVAATIFGIATPNVIYYYFAMRLGMMGLLFIFDFVMTRIGRPMGGSRRVRFR